MRGVCQGKGGRNLEDVTSPCGNTVRENYNNGEGGAKELDQSSGLAETTRPMWGGAQGGLSGMASHSGSVCPFGGKRMDGKISAEVKRQERFYAAASQTPAREVGLVSRVGLELLGKTILSTVLTAI